MLQRDVKNMKSLKSKIATVGCLGTAAISLVNVAPLKVMWACGMRNSHQVVSALASSIISCIPGGNSTKVYRLVTQIINKGVSAWNGDWYDLAWTIADLAMSFVPAAYAAKIVYAVVRNIPLL